MSVLQSWPVQREFDPKDMPFRRLGGSGLRVPLFSLGGCEWRTTLSNGRHWMLGNRVDFGGNGCWWSSQGEARGRRSVLWLADGRDFESRKSSKPPLRMESTCLIQQRLMQLVDLKKKCNSYWLWHRNSPNQFLGVESFRSLGFVEQISSSRPKSSGVHERGQMTEAFPENSMSICRSISLQEIDLMFLSIVEGTQESLARLGLTYVDVIFAHRHDHNGWYCPPFREELI